MVFELGMEELCFWLSTSKWFHRNCQVIRILLWFISTYTLNNEYLVYQGIDQNLKMQKLSAINKIPTAGTAETDVFLNDKTNIESDI